jgi:hypothetical protein
MAGLLNRVKVATSTTGTGTITLGTADTGFFTVSGADGVDGAAYSYVIEDGSNSEISWGVWNSSANTLTRNLIKSTTGSLLSLSGSAKVFVSPSDRDLELRPGYASGRYHALYPGGPLPITGGTPVTAGSLYLAPVFVERDTTMSELYCTISTTQASQNCQIGIYACDRTSLMPTGAPIYNTGNLSTAVAQSVGGTGLSLYFQRGWYWAGGMASAAAAFRVIVASGGPASLNYFCGSNSFNSTDQRHLVKTGTFGTWPTLTGSYSGDSLADTESSSRCPVLFFRP